MTPQDGPFAQIGFSASHTIARCIGAGNLSAVSNMVVLVVGAAMGTLAAMVLQSVSAVMVVETALDLADTVMDLAEFSQGILDALRNVCRATRAQAHRN